MKKVIRKKTLFVVEFAMMFLTIGFSVYQKKNPIEQSAKVIFYGENKTHDAIQYEDLRLSKEYSITIQEIKNNKVGSSYTSIFVPFSEIRK